MNTLDSLFHWVLLAGVRASALVLVVLAARAFLKKRLPARWRYAMWLPVLAALVLPGIPVLPAWLTAMWGETRMDWAATSAAVPASQVFPPPVIPAPVDDRRSPTILPRGETPAVRRVPAETPPPEVAPEIQRMVVAVAASRRPVPWRRTFAWTWIAGVALAVGFVGGSYVLTLRRIRRHSVPAAPEWNERIAVIAQSLGLRRVPRVCFSAAVATPAVCGWLRPMLLLNATFPAEFTEDEADMVLRHELTHIRRGDLLLNPILCALLALHWFNPLLWLAFSRVRADREAACDADVLRDAATARRVAYGKTLLKMETAIPPAGMCLGFVGILQRGSALRHRIEAIIARPQPSLLLRTTLAFGIIGMAVLGLARAADVHKLVTADEFKKYFENTSHPVTIRPGNEWGVGNRVAEITVPTKNPLTGKWTDRRLAVELDKLDPDLRQQVERVAQWPGLRGFGPMPIDGAPPQSGNITPGGKPPEPFAGRGDWGGEIQGLSAASPRRKANTLKVKPSGFSLKSATVLTSKWPSPLNPVPEPRRFTSSGPLGKKRD